MLSALLVLGHGWTFDDCAEATNISEKTHRVFFGKFVAKWSSHKYPALVRCPETESEFRECGVECKQAGFDGCFASIDCVHIPWDLCPYSLTNICTGKEKYGAQCQQFN